VATNSHAQVLGDPVDVSQDFQKMENVYFVGSRVNSFDAATGQILAQVRVIPPSTRKTLWTVLVAVSLVSIAGWFIKPL